MYLFCDLLASSEAKVAITVNTYLERTRSREEMIKPWLIEIPWYYKVTRMLHCIFTMFPSVLLDYWILDIETVIKGIKN